MPSRKFSLAVNRRPPRPFRSASGGGSFSRCAHSTGTSVTATSSDISSEKMTTTDSCLNRMLEMPVRKSSGTNTAMCVRIDATMAPHTSSLPSIGGGDAILAVLHVPERVLEHDDRGIDDHADAKRETAERHDVQRVAGEIEQRERADDRNRNRRADDERRAEAAEEAGR